MTESREALRMSEFSLEGKEGGDEDCLCLHARTQLVLEASCFCSVKITTTLTSEVYLSRVSLRLTLKKVFPLQLKMDLTIFLFASMSCEMVTPPRSSACSQV